MKIDFTKFDATAASTERTAGATENPVVAVNGDHGAVFQIVPHILIGSAAVDKPGHNVAAEKRPYWL